MIDENDIKILNILQKDARTPNIDIAREVNMAPSAVSERLKKLHKSGMIESYEARLNADKLELGLLAFVYVRTQEAVGDMSVANELVKIPNVLEVYNIAGEDCYLIKVRAKSTSELGSLLRDKIGSTGALTSTRTTIVMETYKETLALPLNDLNEKKCRKKRTVNK